MSFSKGGYQIFDLTGVSGASATTIAGSYAKCSSGKPIFVKGLLFFAPQFASAVKEEDESISIQLVTYHDETAAILSINVTPEDVVSMDVIVLAQPEEG